jgi:hypothetical protein
MLLTVTTSRLSSSFVDVAWKNGHRDRRDEPGAGPNQVDDQPVAANPDSADIGGPAFGDVRRADNRNTPGIGDELHGRGGQIVVGGLVDRVLEVRGGYRHSVAETEALADEERVAPPVVRDREPRADLRHELAARPVVVELAAVAYCIHQEVVM